jgi:hypothetical protein
MLPQLHVDQMALAPWYGKIDGDDSLIVTLVCSLDSRYDEVRKYMADDYFLLTTSYIVRMLPLLALSEERIKKRIARLAKIGILDVRIAFNKRTGHRTRYVKPSKLFYQAKRKAEKIADGAKERAEKAPARAREYRVENDPMQYKVENDPLIGSKTTQDQLNDHKRGDDSLNAAPPPHTAAGGPAVMVSIESAFPAFHEETTQERTARIEARRAVLLAQGRLYAEARDT